MAVLIEAPVIMLMSASTALARDRDSYRRLRNFAQGCNALATILLLVVLIPQVYETLALTLLGLPEDVARLTYGALWFFLPWPSAIGYRRFLHGLLIRAGRTRLVALGTILRLGATVGAGLMLYLWFDWPGAWIGAASLSVGVITEAVIARWMAASSIRHVLTVPGPTPSAKGFLDYRRILDFYYPLALTSAHRAGCPPHADVLHGSIPSTPRVPGRIPGGSRAVLRVPCPGTQLPGSRDRPGRGRARGTPGRVPIRECGWAPA